MTKPSKERKELRANKLSSISPKYVEDHQLEDSPAKLFRAILRKMEMNPFRWNNFLSRYLDWVVTNPDPEKAKVERQTRSGNIRDTYFHTPRLTFNKFLEGLSITEFEECQIDITVKDLNGNIIRVSDSIKLVTRDRKKLIEVAVTKDAEKNK